MHGAQACVVGMNHNGMGVHQQNGSSEIFVILNQSIHIGVMNMI